MEKRPNFIVIMTDQQRGDCLSADGHPVLLTPNMDSIGGRGARFTHAYSTCPVCIPARRSFLTGQFPSTHGVVGYEDSDWDGETVASILARAGYQTAWLGRSMHQQPADKPYGFETVIQKDHRIDPDDYDKWVNARAPEGGGYYGAGPMHNDWTARPWHLPEPLHHTNWTTGLALDFLKTRDPARPFFLVASYIAPHPPLIPPAFYMERYLRLPVVEPAIGDWAVPPENDGVGDGPAPRKVRLAGEALRSARAGYYGLINHVDDQIRRILSRVEWEDPSLGDTVVIFVSDHGEMLGDHYYWRKSLPYEAAARVPLMVQAPARFRIGRGKVIGAPACIEDIMPTMLDMAGVAAPEGIDGKSLLPIMRGETSVLRPCLHVECAPEFHCLTDGGEKYVWFVEEGREQFFDLAAEANELHDLAADPSRAARVKWWRERMIEELAGRPEGFSDGKRLIPGRPYHSIIRRKKE